jgi:glycosyltransferase involved in cell wall biosynthesis
MRPVKRIGDFVAAVQMAREEQPELIGVVVGDGPDRPAIEATIADRSAIHLLGHRDDVQRVLAAADIFALASEHEAAPMAILEAMASALPVVSTRVGSVPELVAEEETGLLVPPAHPEALARALAELAGDPDRRRLMGRAGQARHRADWSAERMIDGYEGALERTLTPGAALAFSGSPSSP